MSLTGYGTPLSGLRDDAWVREPARRVVEPHRVSRRLFGLSIQSEADEINDRYQRQCFELGVIFSDISLDVHAIPGTYAGGTGWGSDDKHKPSCHLI